MSKTLLGILTGILIFIAAGILGVYWIGKMRGDREEKRPRLVWMDERPPSPNPFR
jgi:hypothetical protein